VLWVRAEGGERYWYSVRARIILRYRDQWIGWTNEQRRQRLALVATNARFSDSAWVRRPNMATPGAELALARLSEDWQQRYRHPLAAVETFVDPAQFQGPCTRRGLGRLGLTPGAGEWAVITTCGHNKPKRLFVRSCVGMRAEVCRPNI